MPKLYENLNISQLGLIFQTSDGVLQNNGHVSRPNVYLEKGYLMGKLRKRYKRLSREECEAVFVFKEKSVDIESDNLGIGRTDFDNEQHCKSQLFRFIYWIWQVTTLNSEHTIFLMEKAKAGLNQKDFNNYEAYARLIKSDIRNNKSTIRDII